MGPPPRRRLRTPRKTLTPPTTVHLVRHATHGLLPHTLAGRMPGVPLDHTGRQQAARLADDFAGQPIAAVLASPIQRAQETAASIAARLGLPVQTDAGFQEIDFGAWTGHRFDTLDHDPAWQAWNRLRSMAACPEGETMHQAQSRALLSLARLRTAHPGAHVIVVSHADVLKALLASALGFSLDLIHRLSIAPASITTMTVFDHDVRVDGVNRHGLD